MIRSGHVYLLGKRALCMLYKPERRNILTRIRKPLLALRARPIPQIERYRHMISFSNRRHLITDVDHPPRRFMA